MQVEPEPFIQLFFKYLREQFFGKKVENYFPKYEVYQEYSETKYSKISVVELIRSFDVLYLGKATSVPYDVIHSYQKEVNYLIDNLDVKGHKEDKKVHQIYELQALIYLAQSKTAFAVEELQSAYNLDNDPNNFVTERARRCVSYQKWAINYNGGINSTNNTSLLESNHSANNSNKWSNDIVGKGYSEDSKFDAIRKQVFERDGYKCVLCGKSNENLTVDHITELSFGGTNKLSNLRTLCKNCHEYRHNKKFMERDFDVDDDYGENYKVSPKMKALNKAMETGKGIGVKYVDREGLYSERVIHPKKIYKGYRNNDRVFNKNMVYIDAFCELDNDDRTFRLNRLSLCNSRRNFYDNATNSYTSSPWADSINKRQ